MRIFVLALTLALLFAIISLMETRKIVVNADIASLGDVLAFAEAFSSDLPAKLSIAIEEIFVNIVNYSYVDTETVGEVCVSFSCDGDKISVTFEDSGIPYNPLDNDEPDITAPAHERQIGGLGIFMVKKLTDGMEYHYSNGKNILTIFKNMKRQEHENA
jgi:anti-sigma regulatory factor (Ser/Thr protein kinase)